MTATTETLLPPPAIPASTLDPLLDDRERSCEIPVVGECDRIAAWVMSAVCSVCGGETRLACDEHKQRLVQRGAKCRLDQVTVQITRVEPIR